MHLEVRYKGQSINPEYLFEFTNEVKIRSDLAYVTKKWASPRYHRSTKKSNIVLLKSLEDYNKEEEQRQKVYTVKKGDTLYGIANLYGLRVSHLCKTNSISHNSTLRIGQQIIIE